MGLRPAVVLPLFLLACAGGCASVLMTAAGVGGGVMATHQLAGYVYRTFTEPLPRVREAAMAALERMALEPAWNEDIPGGERFLTWSGDRTIEIELEALTPNATRMRVVTRLYHGVVLDSATSLEIINQTAKSFAANDPGPIVTEK